MYDFKAIQLAIATSLVLGLPACDDGADGPDDTDSEFRHGGGGHHGKLKPLKYNTNGANLHLERTVRFHPLQAGADPDNGRALFGVAADLVTEDASGALFEGFSAAAQQQITGNGRSCFTCHRGNNDQFGLPVPPLTDSIALNDPLFTGIDADAGGDPDAFDNLNERALVKYRVNRFDPRINSGHPFKDVFAWRKSPQLLNLGLNQGFLNDNRGRVMFETARGAVFSHTQDGDARFDDLFPVSDGNDMEAFMFSLFTDPTLAALRDPNDPMHDTLVDDPFYTVPITTNAQDKGRKVFEKKCFACHNTPQTFSALDNIEPLGNGERTPDFPGWAPAVSRTYNVGVAEANFHGLRFTRFDGPGQFSDIVIPLADEDGTLNEHVVETDLGLAMTTGRSADIGRFKVPQLRNLANNAPYMHDNSLETIEDVVDYFTSDEYNNSADGHLFQIHLSAQDRADLLEFLYIL
jgi:mono/diheme cytochrome c family protein